MYAVNFVLRGVGTYHDDQGKSYPLVPGTLYQRFPNRTDLVEVDPASDFAEFWVVIDGEIYENLHGLGIISPSSVLDTGINQRVVEDYVMFRDACRFPTQKISHHRLVGKVVDFLSNLYERSQLKASEGYWPSVVHDAARLLEENFKVPCHSPDVARKLGVSHTSLRRAFREHFGISPGDYRLRKSIDAACQLLTYHSIKETSDLLGYCDPFAFSVQFKKQTGTSPSDFRQGLRQRVGSQH